MRAQRNNGVLALELDDIGVHIRNWQVQNGAIRELGYVVIDEVHAWVSSDLCSRSSRT